MKNFKNKKIKKGLIAGVTAISLCLSPAVDAKKRNTKPTLNVTGALKNKKKVTINEGDKVFVKATAKDKEDGNLNKNVRIRVKRVDDVPSNLKTGRYYTKNGNYITFNEDGTYKITYLVEDSNRATTKKVRKVIVKDENDNQNVTETSIPQPTNSPVPNVTSMPVNTSVPIKTSMPGSTMKPTTTFSPISTPTSTPESTPNIDYPENSNIPVETERPTTTFSPVETKNPVNTLPPQETELPTETPINEYVISEEKDLSSYGDVEILEFDDVKYKILTNINSDVCNDIAENQVSFENNIDGFNYINISGFDFFDIYYDPSKIVIDKNIILPLIGKITVIDKNNIDLSNNVFINIGNYGDLKVYSICVIKEDNDIYRLREFSVNETTSEYINDTDEWSYKSSDSSYAMDINNYNEKNNNKLILKKEI